VLRIEEAVAGGASAGEKDSAGLDGDSSSTAVSTCATHLVAGCCMSTGADEEAEFISGFGVNGVNETDRTGLAMPFACRYIPYAAPSSSELLTGGIGELITLLSARLLTAAGTAAAASLGTPALLPWLRGAAGDGVK
jgi:hypothetical protein